MSPSSWTWGLSGSSEREMQKQFESSGSKAMEDDKWVNAVCTLLAIDHTKLFYRACTICERTLPGNLVSGSSSLCHFCNFNSFNAVSSSKRLFRVLISIASVTQVFTVICFDRAARVLFGCSADEFFEFAKLHPLAASAANDILQGEKFKMELSEPKNGNAQNLRVVKIVPLRSDFQPAIATLRELYQGSGMSEFITVMGDGPRSTSQNGGSNISGGVGRVRVPCEGHYPINQ